MCTDKMRSLSPTVSVEEILIQTEPGFWHYRSYRLHLTLLMGLALFVHALARATLSIAMVCMVNSTASKIRSGKLVDAVNSNVSNDGCANDQFVDFDYEGDQTWTHSDESMLFSSIYWGGVLSALPAGLAADRYSAKMVVIYCLLLQSLGCLLTPATVAYGGLIPLFVLRLIMGIGGQSVINPAMAVIIARWIPPAERSTVIGLYTGGNQIAFVAAMPLNAWLCRQKEFLNGWPSIFYVSGIVTLLAIVPWLIFVNDYPKSNRWISKNELHHIEYSLRIQNIDKRKAVLNSVPWVKMLTSLALWSCITGNFAATILTSTLESYIPTYFKQVLHLDLSRNGVLSAIPYLAQWASKILFSIAADLLTKKTTLSRTWICRISNCLNTFATGAFLIACAYTDCHQTALAVTLLTVANFLTSGQVTAYWTSLVCMAPAFTGIVNSLVRLSGQFASLIAPFIVGSVIVEGTSAEWRIVFFITVAGLVIAGVQFLIFGSAEVQDWAETAIPGQKANSIADQKSTPSCETVLSTVSEKYI